MYRLLIFLLINFGALAIGGIFAGKGVPSNWYDGLNKAPWTPPGWVFGFAWTTIMICFSIYMAYLWPSAQNRNLLISVFLIQWFLNVLWNPAFFYFHHVFLGLIIILALTVLIGFMLYYYGAELKFKSIFLLPYFVWLIIATSLNAYIYFKN